jgi:hypothetical protein
MSSPKSETNRKFTASTTYRQNFDKIFTPSKEEDTDGTHENDEAQRQGDADKRPRGEDSGHPDGIGNPPVAAID